MLPIPELPDVPPEQRAEGTVGMRYEDLAQDGALKVGGMPHAIGMVCFRQLFQHSEVNLRTRPLGIVPILSRLRMAAIDGPISVRNAVFVRGQYELGHTRDADGNVERIVLNMHADLFGSRGHTHDIDEDPEAARLHVGRVVAEHVFTKPWGAPQERKVLTLPLASGPSVPERTVAFAPASATLGLPTDGRWLEPELRRDEAPIQLGLTHTDANQHVNSLVYPQLFEDAALRRAHDLGRDTRALLVDRIDIAFRKPCFAGQRVYLWLRAFELDGRLGAVGYLGPEGCAPERAASMCLLLFREGELSR